MRMAAGRRRRIVLAFLAVIAVVAAYHLLDVPTRIYSYRVVDDRTVVLGTTSGRGAWMRVTGINETPVTVTITVSSLFIQLGPGTAEGIAYESVARLHDPLGSRTVVDGSDGHTVDQVHCPPPDVNAPVCP